MEHIEYDLLYKVNSPADLKRLSIDELPQYCRELRQYIIEECSKGKFLCEELVPGIKWSVVANRKRKV